MTDFKINKEEVKPGSPLDFIPSKEEAEEPKPKYVSKDGLIETKVIRGFSEIESIYKLIYGTDDESCDPLFGVYMCGGYIRYMCSPHPNPAKPGDLDIYFEEKRTMNILIDALKLREFTIKHENEISITFAKITDHKNLFFGTPNIQLIKPIKDGAIVATGSMSEILSNFDFTVVRAGLVSPRTALVDADFLHDEENRILRIKNIHCPISSTLRCMKYSAKGYWLPPLQCCKLFIDWEDRTDEYRMKIIESLKIMEKGEGLTKKEVDEMERLMRID